MKPKNAVRLAFPLAIAVLFAAPSAKAATFYWDANGNSTSAVAATGTWGTDNFWSTDPLGGTATSPQTINNTSDLFFSAASNSTGGIVTVSTTQAAHSITFDDATGAITLSGGTSINLGSATAGSGIFSTNATGSATSISTPLILNSAATAIAISNSGTQLQTIGAITGAATSGTQTITVASGSSGGIKLNGIIADVSGSASKIALTINNTSTGITTLSGANTYTGATNVTGTLIMGNTKALGTAAGGVVLNNATTLDIATAGSDTAYNITVNSGKIATIVSDVSSGTAGINHTMGTFNIGGSASAGGTQLNITKGATVSSGTPTITFGAVTLGAGATNTTSTFNPTSASLIIGTVTVTVTTSGTKTLNLDGTATGNQVTGIIADALGTAVAVTKANTGTWAINGANTYTGATTLSGGILSLGNSLALQNSALNTTASTTGNASNGLKTTVTTLTMGGLNGNKDLSTVFTTSSGAYNTVTALTLNPGTGATPAYSGGIGDGASGMTLTKTGAGTQTLAGTNTYTGATTVNAGTLTLDYSVSNASKLSDTSALVLGGGTVNLSGGTHTEVVASTMLTDNTLSRVTSSVPGSVLQMNTITHGVGASIDFGASNIATTDNLNNAYGILGTWATTVDGFAMNSTSTADGLITTVPFSDVTRLSGGTQAIPNSSTNIRIIEGTGTAADITLATTTTINTLTQSASGGTGAAMIDLGTQTLCANAILVATGAGSLTIGNGTLATATPGGDLALVNSTANSFTIASVIADNTSASTLTKTGSGIVTLAGTNTYSGTTYVDAGTLKIGNNGAVGTLGTGTVSVTSIAILQFNRTDNITLGTGNLVTGSGLVQLANTGTVAVAADNQFNTTGNLMLGTAGGTVATGIDLTNGSSTFGGLLVDSNNSATTNTITIGAGKTLTTNGNVTIGTNVSASGVTKVIVTGASGTWNVVKSGGTFQVGAATGATNADTVTVDLSALDTFSADLGNAASGGTFRVGNLSTFSSATVGSESMALAATSTIKTGTLSVGDNSGQAVVNSLLLGSGTQTLQADTINIGLIASNRSSGRLAFNGSSGILKIRAYDGTSAAALNMAAGSFSTSATLSNTFDVTGHSADLLFSTVDLMNTRAGSAGSWSSTFSFDSGTLSVGTLKIGTRAAGSGAGTETATANIGSTANLTNSATLGTVTIATQSTTSGTIAGNLNIAGTATTVGMTSLTVANDTANTGGTATGMVGISGGTVTVTNGITLAARTSAGIVTGTLNLTGGSLTVGGDIVQTGTGGTVTGTLTLNGGLLDLASHNLGASGNTITFNAQSGTLKNVGQINNGAGLAKTTTGTLTLAGTNTYTGNTVVSAGTLELAANAQLKFVLGAASGVNNSLTGEGTVILNGAFVIDTSAADALSSGTWTLENVTSLTGAYGSTFSIVGFTDAGGDKWTKVNGTKLYTFDETTGILTLGTAYDTWALNKGLNGTAGHEAGKSDDPDHDDHNNLYEFAFDGNPLSGANDGKIVSRIALIGADRVLTLTLPVRTGATFSPSSGDQLSALIDGICYRVEGDVNLSTFADSITEVTGDNATTIQTGLPGLSTGWTYRSFRAPGTVATAPKSFLRASISDTP